MTCLTICQTAVRVFSPVELPERRYLHNTTPYCRLKSLSAHSESLWKQHGRFATLTLRDPMTQMPRYRFFRHISQRKIRYATLNKSTQPCFLGRLYDTYLSDSAEKFYPLAKSSSEPFSAHLSLYLGKTQHSIFLAITQYASLRNTDKE